MTDTKTHAQVRGDRNCPTCRGTGVRDCSGSILYDNDGRVRSSSSATTPCHCAKAAPAVPDDVAETANRLRQATFTKGRMRGGSIGQTIDAAMRSTFHEVSAWDLITAAEALEAQAAQIDRLTDDLAEALRLAETHMPKDRRVYRAQRSKIHTALARYDSARASKENPA